MLPDVATVLSESCLLGRSVEQQLGNNKNNFHVKSTVQLLAERLGDPQSECNNTSFQPYRTLLTAAGVSLVREEPEPDSGNTALECGAGCTQFFGCDVGRDHRTFPWGPRSILVFGSGHSRASLRRVRLVAPTDSPDSSELDDWWLAWDDPEADERTERWPDLR